jgi:hypothetical protein
MANANPSRIGQNLGAGATDALWLDVFGGEILTAFEVACKFKDKIRTRTISSGKSARFPAMHRAVGQYHTPGTEIAGQNILHTEISLTTDDLLIAPAEIAQIDELKNHYDVRAPYATELGRALALIYDRIASMSILKAARAAELFTGDGGGGSVAESDVSGSADFTTSGADLWEAFGKAVQVLDEKDVPVDIVPVYGAVLPAQYYLMARNSLNIDKDFGGAGSSQDMTLRNAYGVNVIKSNALLFGKDVTAYDAGTNADGLVGAPVSVAGKYALPASFPSKYQADLTGSTGPVGIVWTEAAAGMLQLLGLQMEQEWDMRRQVTFMLAKMACGGGPLRSKCAVEIKKS